MKQSFLAVLVSPSHKKPVMWPNFGGSYLKRQFEIFKTVKIDLKLSKNFKK